MLHMPKGPKADEYETYSLEDIYNFVKELAEKNRVWGA